MPPSAPESDPRWQRKHNRYAIGVVIFLHVALGMFLMLGTLRKPSPKPEARSVDVVYLETKVPEKKIPEPPPEPKPVEPPPIDVPRLPDLPPVKVTESPVPAPPAANAPAPAPAPAAAAAPPPPPPPPPVAKATESTPPKLFEECSEESDRHMIADVYRLAANTQSVTEIRRRKPNQRVCMAQLNITPRSFKEGFPGLGSTNEWFGLDIRFTVNITETATYELMLLADDGAILSVDDVNVIDNDGIHAPTPVATKLKLEKGLRNFRVRYFQGPGPDLALMLAWKKPGMADYGYIPRSLIGRPPGAMLASSQPKE
ncbi:PA14 domain-containing protein [Pseudoduganella namucuonensis]|uniref:PA14 domain-containing protein n=1 Tax=Pseudoduganella namucuonensis TaxID=1035707 RepID=UPI0011601A1C|nr:PA14 domain-containing protein [Pseudoduganella namucuonensis]